MSYNEQDGYSKIYNDVDLTLEKATFSDGSNIVPHIELQNNKKYIEWVDYYSRHLNISKEKREYPQKLLELYNNSSLHHSICQFKADKIAGGGLELVDESSPQAQKTKEFIDQINKDGDDLHEINYKLALDLVIFNTFSTQLNYRKDWSHIDFIRHIEVSKLRLQTPDKEGEIHGYYWAFDWTKYRPVNLIYLESFNEFIANERKENFKAIEQRIIENNDDKAVQELKELVDQGNTQVFVYKAYQPDSFFYPVPDYVGGVPSIEIDILSDVYAASSLMNGMDNGISIVLRGDPNDKESRAMAKQILKSYGGARKAGKPVIIFAPDMEQAPKIQDIGNSNSLASKYRILNDSTQTKILMSHRIPHPSMVGISTPGKLGESNATVENQEIFFNNYVKPRQKILNSYWSKIMKYNGLDPVQVIEDNVFNENLIESQDNNIETE